MQRIPMTSYEQAHSAFQWEIPATFNFGTDVIDHWAKDPDKLALIWANSKGDEKRLTFADVSRLTNRFAKLLASLGIAKGDRVIVMLPRIPQWQIAMIGCHKLGAVPIPCVTMLTEKDINFRVQHTGAVAAITTAENAHKFSDAVEVRISVGACDGWTEFDARPEPTDVAFVPAQTSATDPAVLYYTSGSSGMPKGVSHSSGGLYAWRVSAW